MTQADLGEAYRRLAGILAADVVGYSAMVGTDEPATLARVRALRTDIIEPVAAVHGGRLFKTTGDGFLIAFASAVQALRCAAAIQERLNSDPDALRLRIGLHQGEVVAEGDDLVGDGVIIAARLEPLAEPGGICISGRVREDAAGKLSLEVEDLGTPELRNIAARVQVFRVRLGMPERPALPLPDKPSIAVLAFANMSGDPEQEYFSDGIADDIITELSRIRWLFVIARNSSFAYKGNATDVKRIGRELGVRYVLEGSVRRGGQRIRVNAQLIDAETGNHIWADRYDRDLTDFFAVQDELTLAVTIAIGPAVADAERRRALRKLPSNLGAWETYQRGMWHLSRVRSEDVPRARELFNRALELDPALAAAHTGLGSLFLREGTMFASRPLLEALRLSGEEAQKALELDPNDAEAHGLRAEATGHRGDYTGSFHHVERALLVNPNCAMAHHIKGWLQIFTGQPAEGRGAILYGIRLDPRRASYPFVRSHLVMSYYIEGDYETTVAEAERVIADRPDHPYAYRWLAAALGQLGRSNEARAALDKALAIARDAFRLYVEQRVPWMSQAVYEHMLDGLRKAGWRG
jgi:adenylate cyclase